MLRYLNSLVFVFAFPVACGGSSANFDDGDGDAGDPGTGGSSAGTGGTSGGSFPTGGDAGIASGGTSGSATGGSGGTVEGGTGFGGTATGGTETGGAAGEGATGGSSGGLGGSAPFGGAAGMPTGGFAGQMGGFAGVGGKPDERCPFRLPSGACEPDGLSCRYDLARMCLCTNVTQLGICSEVDPRCTAMADRAAPPGGASGIGIPIATSTCDCRAGTWACRVP